MMGLALHKDFKAAVPVNYIYIAYSYNSTSLRISRFTYNTTTGQLGSELQLVNGIPAGNDHSSGRLIYGPDDKLYYSCGDQGANQFNNRCSPILAQQTPTAAELSANDYTKYEGKILRINLDGTIPSNNPLIDPDGAGPEVAVRSHIFTFGHRNPQGLVFEMNANNGSSYPTLKTGGIFYSSEHGVRTDDEINIISSGNNYGWPYWAGFRNNPAQNYRYINWSSASGGNCSSTSYNEVVIPTGATVIQENAFAAGSFTDPIFSMYPACNGASNCAVTLTTGTNWMQYPTIAPSSIDYYGFTNIPGWYKSLLIPTLRRGTLYRYQLDAAGTGILNDSVPYFFRTDRYRDLALKNGNIIFTVTDSIGSTSGPSGGGTSTLTRPGTILKYTFLGYAHNGGTNKSTIPSTIDIAAGTPNACTTGSTVTIDATNNNYWVPITGPDGNILAEIKANGNNLGVVTSSFYTNTAAIRQSGGVHYLDRNITITPAVQPSSAVSIRLYLNNAEFNSLDADPLSGISAIGDLRILKNSDACGSAAGATTTLINPVFAEAHGTFGYMLQANINSFSSFYFGSSNILLPLDLLTFKGSLQNNTALLQWITANENNTSHFVIERSADGNNYTGIGTVNANGNSGTTAYSFTDNTISGQSLALVYYRLKMVSNSGSYTYSGVITISVAANTGSITVSPNPAHHEVKVSIVSSAGGKAQWRVIDNTGRPVLHNSISLLPGSNSIIINIEKLPAGVYHLDVQGAGTDEKVKFQKL
jgi:PQQ-dependent dehydrogenase (s-GDH family)